MEKTCVVCETVFDGRADAKTCGDKCRQILRRISVTGVADRIVTDGEKVSQIKAEELSVTKLPEITLDVPCDTGVRKENPDEVYLDLEKDLKLDLKKDLGCYAVTPDGWFIRPDITIQQVRNIRRIVESKHGWPHRTYDDTPTPYSTVKI